MELFPIPGTEKENLCGSCTACCTDMGIHDMPEGEPYKPAGEPCPHLLKGVCSGCDIYETKPKSCSTYECLWLAVNNAARELGTTEGDLFPLSLRPDICHAILNPLDEDKGLAVMLDPKYPNAWMDRDLNKFMCDMLKTGKSVVIGCGDQHWQFMEDGSRRKLVKVGTIEHGFRLMPEDLLPPDWEPPKPSEPKPGLVDLIE